MKPGKAERSHRRSPESFGDGERYSECPLILFLTFIPGDRSQSVLVSKERVRKETIMSMGINSLEECNYFFVRIH